MENTIKNLVNIVCFSIRITAPAKSRTVLTNEGDAVIIRSYGLTTTNLIEYENKKL